jgi:carboxylesterase type B
MIVLGTYHASEVAFVFHNQWPAVIHAFKPADHRVANTFGTYWTNLAAFGNVNGPAGRKGVYVRGGDDVIHWPEYSSFNNESILVINDPPQVQQALFGDQCRFWDRLIQ